MKNLLTTLVLLSGITLAAQTEKGVSPLSSPQGTTPHSTRAVVIGISDYQDENIPDLRFADRDAEAFANFLRSPAGGSLDGDHLKLLTNSGATLGQFAAALDWLMEVTKEGDNAIVYFSGHGDVEKKTITQPGYLLCWDAPSRVYMGGGAFALNMLQEVISTLSIQNKARVVVITDACRSGTLAGQSVGGAQATAANLAKQYANEIKILSCQPNEYSIEGEQWGGGRGAFSFNLVDALYGLADGNNDLFVTLQEVGRYLEDHVTAEVAPVSQVPMVIGNRTERLASVDSKLLADLRSGKTNQMKMLSPIESRGMEDDVLAGVDTTVRELYRLFKQALKDKVFLEPATACADFYYEKLIAEPGLARLHSNMTRNYAAALQDDAQQVLNTMLKTGLTELVLSGAFEERLYEKYPRYLGRAAELLGKTHYLYPVLMARQAFFMGKIAKKKEERKQHFLTALEWQPGMPHAMLELGVNEGYQNLDSAKTWLLKSAELLSGWVLPTVKLSNIYREAGHFDEAFAQLDLAGQVDSNSVLVWYERAELNMQLHFYEVAEPLLQKVIKNTSDEVCFPCAHMELGRLHMQRGQPKEAQSYYLTALALYKNSNNNKGFCNPCAYVNIGVGYWYMDSLDQALVYFQQAIQADSNFIHGYQNAGVVYILNKNMNEAEKYLKKAIQMQPKNAVNYSNLGGGYYMAGRFKEAEEYLLKGIELDTTNPNTYICLGDLYRVTDQYQLSEKHYRNALQINKERIEALNGLGIIFNKTGRLAEAEQEYSKILQLEANNFTAFYGLAVTHGLRENYDLAFDYLEQSFKNGFKDVDSMLKDPDLAPLRAKEGKWKELMKKYFPDQVKD